MDHTPITPPSQSASASWTKTQLNYPVKDSPARAPDPEHLKAVWSQASDKGPVHPVNSLEGIADDLTGLPFTLQDVKSEDGETPPPTSSAAPSRMSLHDVTRAFQQVPSSTPNTAPQRSTPLSPTSAGGPVARHPNFQYSLPPPTPNMRPSFATYPSPMMSHSPSPTLVYPSTSPVPGRMAANGHSPMFNQPLWVPLPAPPNQTHGMMRPIPSSYSTPMIPYPSPNGAPSMYGHHTQANMQNPAPQQGGAPQARGRGIPPLSPAMQHAAAAHAPMYASSPILMHAPGIHGHSYMSTVSAGRGQLRNDTPGHSPMPHAPSGHHPSSHTGYTPVQPTSFARANW
jgi:serine/arginine repetitive matrix protein 2